MRLETVSIAWRGARDLDIVIEALQSFNPRHLILNVETPRKEATDTLLSLRDEWIETDLIIRETGTVDLMDTLLGVIQLVGGSSFIAIDPDCSRYTRPTEISRHLCGEDGVLLGREGCTPMAKIDGEGYVTHLSDKADYYLAGAIWMDGESAEILREIVIKTYPPEKVSLASILNLFISKYGVLRGCLVSEED